ncbi:hypothetical protein [Paraburkholderia sp. J7]|uniref:hypothetical protein n=1 Tax=Paraburkholderia sp. J7 TaxID=2805438 RepID=UPI002AB73664|nr:hypothetical protein [Paraburkholderia sp. J7]
MKRTTLILAAAVILTATPAFAQDADANPWYVIGQQMQQTLRNTQATREQIYEQSAQHQAQIQQQAYEQQMLEQQRQQTEYMRQQTDYMQQQQALMQQQRRCYGVGC